MIFECKDLFDLTLGDCTFQNTIYSSFNFTVLKKICKDPNWIPEITTNSTITTTLTPTSTQYSGGNSDSGLSISDKITIGSSVAGIFLVVIVTTITLWYTSEIFRNHVRNFWQWITRRMKKNNQTNSTIELDRLTENS